MRMRTATFLLLCLLTATTAPAQKSLSGSVPQADLTVSCRALKAFTVPASQIGLPTTGAYVQSAKLVHDSSGDGEFCKVLARVRPVDPSAQEIRFEVNLPTNWNHKAVQFGGAIFDGWLGDTNGLKRTVLSVKSEPGPLARGFATFGGDSGHHKQYLLLPGILNLVNASFARNAEERRNFAQDGLKKTHDAAVAIVERRYGDGPKRMFFLGGSTGGREAYSVVQRWPEDYDGVLGAYAGWDQTELDLQYIRVSQAMYAKGGFLPKSKTRLLARSVMKACDAEDGIQDGIIANIETCHFDPAILLCPAIGKRKDCLTPQQLNTVQTFASEQRTAQPLLNGVQTIPGFNVLAGADLTGSMGILHHAEHPPRIVLNSFYYVIGDRVLRFFLTGDNRFDALAFDTTTAGKYAGQLLSQSKASDASEADLTRFARRGGKFIMLHGAADATIPTNASVMYYKMIQNRMSQEEMDRFLRFYLIPGFGHGRGIFDAGFDALGVLDSWVDTGVAPKDLVVVDNNKKSGGRTRPLCIYPTWPKYKGFGDVNSAGSFFCATE